MKVYLLRNGKSYGPYSEESIKDFIDSGVVKLDEKACRCGSEQWIRLGNLLDKRDEELNDSSDDEGLVVDLMALSLRNVEGETEVRASYQ